MKKLLATSILCMLLGAGTALWWRANREQSTPVQTQSNHTPSETPVPSPEPTKEEFDKTRFSTSDPASMWVIVNKNRPIPTTFVPADLTVPNVRLRLGAGEEQMQIAGQIASDVKAMFDAAKADGVTLVFGSGYRSAALQASFYNSYVARDGVEAADRYSARPGTSEHQTGLSFDVTSTSGQCHLEVCFADIAEGKWLASHAHKYGFIIRYPNGKESITGYQYEPWHVRYVGKELSTELNKTGQTLEEFFEL